MKVFFEANEKFSVAMYRVTDAVKRLAPAGIEFVSRPEEADLEILHVIGFDAMEYQSPAAEIVVVQYCGSLFEHTRWWPLWSRAKMVWSYYDLAMPPGATFYRSPLGISPAFLVDRAPGPRPIGILTSGYVTGPGAEAIEEPLRAAQRLGLSVSHLGPAPVGLRAPLGSGWTSIHGVSDSRLAALYGRSRWVSGLRFGEGFELPVVEGLAMGARPIVFDRPETRRWFDGHAVFVPECSGDELIDRLTTILTDEPLPVSDSERQLAIETFSWRSIIDGFWTTLLHKEALV